MKKVSTLSAIMFLMFCATSIKAQVTGTQTTEPKALEDVKKNFGEIDSWRRRFWFSATLAASFDSNIDHEPRGVRSFGVVPSLGLHLQNSAENPSFEMHYEIAAHQYTNSQEWDRVSQNLEVSYRKHLFGRWSARTEGELTLKGSSEDRELNNQYALRQQLEYRFNEWSRLQLVAAYRLKRDPEDSGSDSIDPYAGVRFIQKLRGARRLAVSYRYDKNRSRDPRSRYIRWAYDADFSTPVVSRRNRLSFAVTYKPRLYARTVKLESGRVPRFDKRWIFETQFERMLRSNLQLVAVYRFESRDSNDPDKDFRSQQAGFALTYRW